MNRVERKKEYSYLSTATTTTNSSDYIAKCWLPNPPAKMDTPCNWQLGQGHVSLLMAMMMTKQRNWAWAWRQPRGEGQRSGMITTTMMTIWKFHRPAPVLPGPHARTSTTHYTILALTNHPKHYHSNTRARNKGFPKGWFDDCLLAISLRPSHTTGLWDGKQKLRAFASQLPLGSRMRMRMRHGLRPGNRYPAREELITGSPSDGYGDPRGWYYEQLFWTDDALYIFDPVSTRSQSAALKYKSIHRGA